jgi:hypothetical protein
MALAVGPSAIVHMTRDRGEDDKTAKKILDGSARGMRAAAVPIKHVSEQVK